jgi:5-methylcytosine-specific restriction endonuclease McrBC regulatory subunit McrC
VNQAASLLPETGVGHRIVLDDDEPRAVPGVLRADLTEEEVKRLSFIAVPGQEFKSGALTLRRTRTHGVGQLILRGHLIVVPPTINGSAFLVLLLTDLEGHPSRLSKQFIEELEAESALSPEQWSAHFDVLLSYLYVRWTEGILASHIAQAYVRQEDRLQVLKGKPLWARNMGRHLAEGVHCSYFQLQTDNIFNRLILAGLIKAASLLRGTPWDDRVQNQLFIWHSLARVTIPQAEQFGVAYSKISRLTEHYRPVLRLAEAILFGHAPRDLFSGGAQWLQGFYFDVPGLFERFLGHLLREVLHPRGLVVKEQLAQRGAFVDALDRRYLNVRPDIVILRGRTPVALIDAKYKPRYVEGGVVPLAPRNKVSPEDLYQMFFYQARLRYAYALPRSIPSALVAPRLPVADSPVPACEQRSIRWKAEDTTDVHALKVLSFPLEEVLQTLANGGTSDEALRQAPELASFVDRLPLGPR